MFINEFIIRMLNPLVVVDFRFICIPACIMSSEFTLETLVEKDSPSSRTTRSSFFSRSANFGNVSPFLVGATNTFSELIHPLIKLPNCVLKFYNLSEALGSFGLLPLRGAGTGFVGVLPLPLIFDPPLYILHFTEKEY